MCTGKNATIFSAFSDVSSKSNTLTRLKVISYSVVCVYVCVCFLHTWLTLAGVRTMSRTPVQPAMTPVGTAQASAIIRNRRLLKGTKTHQRFKTALTKKVLQANCLCTDSPQNINMYELFDQLCLRRTRCIMCLDVLHNMLLIKSSVKRQWGCHFVTFGLFIHTPTYQCS